MRLVAWLLRGFIFFALFAFALNNQQTAVVHWFFGVEWRAPMVIVVLAAFAAGCAIGVLAMLPTWWRQRRRRTRPEAASAPKPAAGAAPAEASSSGFHGEQPPREAL